MRLNGVGSEYADLLEAAGVDSPAELAHRNPANLAQTFQELVAARPETVRRVPSEETVAAWIAEAKTLDKVVTHGGGADAGGLARVIARPGSCRRRARPRPRTTTTTTMAMTTTTRTTMRRAPAAAACLRPRRRPLPRPRRPRRQRSAPKEPAKPTGLWARIKGMFGGG